MPGNRPTWINLLYIVSGCLALATTFGTIIATSNRFPADSARPIADITINLNGQNVREHCTTCHPQGRGAGLGLESADQVHPDISPHQVEKLGCTGCHLGEGMALDPRISHGLPGLGSRQILKGVDTQATCYTCHQLAHLRGAEKAWSGYQLFMAKGCSTCHHVAGVGYGGYFGPGLTSVGSQLGLDQLQEAIREPRKEPANSIMPRFPLSRSQARKIAYFLKSRIKQPAYATPMQIQSGLIRLPKVNLIPEGTTFSPGEKLLFQYQCLACHQYREQDGRIAPDLTYIGSLRTREELANFLANPGSELPGAHMPRVPMAADDEQALLLVLSTQATGPLHPGHVMTDSSAPGQILYMQLCQRCHAAGGDGHGPIQPNLADFPRAFSGNAAYFQRRSREQIVNSIQRGIPGTSMPPYGKLLDQQQISQLLGLIFKAFVGDTPDHQIVLQPLPEPVIDVLNPAQQKDLFLDQCSRCHGIAGTGSGPEALQYLPRPRNLRSIPYFEGLEDADILRSVTDGVPGTAMPAFRSRLDGRQLWSLVKFVRELSGTAVQIHGVPP